MQSAMRALPAVDEVVRKLEVESYRLPRVYLLQVTRQIVERFRDRIREGEYGEFDDSESIRSAVVDAVRDQCESRDAGSLRPVINATGIVLHTGLGRAPLSPAARDALRRIADGYSNLEFDLPSGTRGERNDHIEDLLTALTGAESGMMVNNNAAAVLLSLNTMAAGQEAIISRGQLVEIGGSFRIPEVMEKSGATMIEVGTTNRTHLRDYRKAITEQTAMILIAHPSNYRVEGFSTMPAPAEVAGLAHDFNIPVLYDLGSGALFDLQNYGLPFEPLVSEIVDLGIDVITFSGDKLIGGPQAGVIVGKEQYVHEIRKNPMARAVRCDKLIFAAMEATLRDYTTPEQLPDYNVTYTLLTKTRESLNSLGDQVLSLLNPGVTDRLNLRLEPAVTEAGSGSLPTEEIPGIALVVGETAWSPDRIMRWLRTWRTPIVGYIADDRCHLHLRAVFPEQLEELATGLNALAGAMEGS